MNRIPHPARNIPVLVLALAAIVITLPDEVRSQRSPSQGGTLRMQVVDPSPSESPVVRVGLREYTGEPLKVLQFRVISTGPAHVLGVRQGSSLLPPGVWNLHHHIRKGTPGVDGVVRDTVSVVLLAAGAATLAPGDYPDLATVTLLAVQGSVLGEVQLELCDVLGALSKGESAGIQPAAPYSVSLGDR